MLVMNPDYLISIHIIHNSDILVLLLPTRLIYTNASKLSQTHLWIGLNSVVRRFNAVFNCSPVNTKIRANSRFGRIQGKPCYIIIEIRQESRFTVLPWNPLCQHAMFWAVYTLRLVVQFDGIAIQVRSSPHALVVLLCIIARTFPFALRTQLLVTLEWAHLRNKLVIFKIFAILLHCTTLYHDIFYVCPFDI